MNCPSFQRLALIDPQHLPPEALNHAERCPRCQAALKSLRHNDALLRAALVATKSDGLQARVLADAGVDRSRRHFGLGLAAGIGFAVLGGAQWLRLSAQAGSDQLWVDALSQHFEDDPEHLRPADPEAGNRLARALADLGGELQVTLPPVVRAGLCKLKHRTAAHLVFELPDERVVVFLLPHERIDAHFKVAGWYGELQPVSGGTVGVLARHAQSLRQFHAALGDGLRFLPAV
ncbi:MAG: DUF3379 family protein [Gammaproteobacteria bacterium]|nr:DUF3379 family protein [Gammaproteobacteria bacterium]